MTITTIQPCDIDSYIASDAATTNYGTNTTMLHGAYNGGLRRRSLVKFNLSSIPATEICDSAILSLWLAADLANQACTFSAHRLLKNWVENQVTYNIYSTGNSWDTAGALGAGDRDATAMGVSGTVSATASLNTEIQIVLTAAEMQKMYDGTYINYGWLIKSTSETESDSWRVHSREATTSGYWPKLVVVSHVGTTFIPGTILF